WIVGTGSASLSTACRLGYQVQVSETWTFDDYWNDPRFTWKRPRLPGRKKQAFGDNIYHRDANDGSWLQEDSHHSLDSGRPNTRNIKNDTQTDRILVGAEFAYWGGTGPEVPPEFRELCTGRGHKNKFAPALVAAFVDWFHSR